MAARGYLFPMEISGIAFRTDLDWSDPALERWFGTVARRKTQYEYRTAFRAYSLFTNMAASTLVDEALETGRELLRE